ncbi:MAG: hypothetical protein H0V44_15270 [Planctomycetes bacterium]|nr:hypothetical protein [Planctomycetota bacterium]
MRLLILLCLTVATTAADPLMICDFEGEDAKAFEAPPGVVVVDEHAKRGKRSLRIVTDPVGYPGLTFQGGRELSRFRERPIFAMDIFNPQDHAVGFSVRADDASSKDYGSRYNDDGYSARPGWSTVRINLTGLLCSNSRNFSEQRALDMSMLRIFMVFMGPTPDGKSTSLYFDDARLEDTGLPACAGLRAFDFGPVGSGVFSGFTGVTEADIYASGKGYGWIGPESGQRPANPDDLGGDFGSGKSFVVDLAEGAGTYVVELCIDAFGAWATPQSFKHRTVTLNGDTVLDETWDGVAFLEKRYLRFERDEDEPGMDLWERRVKPATPVRRFEAAVKADGKLAVSVHGDGPFGSAMCYMVVYPKAKAVEGAAFMKALDARRKDLFSNEISLALPKTDHPAPKATAEEQARGFIAFARSSDIDIACTASPSDSERGAALALAGCAGERIAGQVGLLPLKAVDAVTATVSDLASADSSISSSAIDIRAVRNLAKRGGIGREATLTPLILEPRQRLPLKPGFTRAFWLTVRIPTGTKPGDYRGSVTLAGGGTPLTVPISLTVHPFVLDAADDATFSCTGTTAGHTRGLYPDLDAIWWTTADAMLKDQADHGLNAVTGGPGMRLTALSGGIATIDWADADRWMALAIKHGLNKRGDSYQGFDLDLGIGHDRSKDALGENDRRAKQKWGVGFAELVTIAYGTVEAHAKERGWPPRSYYLIDEPRPEFGNIEPCRQLIALYAAAAPGTTFSGFYSPGEGRDPYFSMLGVSIAHHTPASLKLCVDAGKQAWDYSAGGSRYDIGRWFFALHRQGMSGFLRNGWTYVNSDPYYDFSDTEGSWAQVYPSASAAGFVATVMWERTATGIADYRYLKTLAGRISAAKTGKRDTAAAEAFLAKTLAPITVEDSGTAVLSAADTAAFRTELVKHIVALAGK